MSKKSFKFEPDRWFKNKNLRSCSSGARGFWVDLLCICHANAGYLHVNGQPADDNQLARMVGEPVKAVRAWLGELGEAGIFSVDDRGLYSSQMRRSTNKPAQKSKYVRRSTKPNTPVRAETVMAGGPQAQTTPAAVVEEEDTITVMATNDVVNHTDPRKVVTKKVNLPWYKYPAGWIRKGLEQSVSKGQDEDMEDFKARVAARIEPGPHLEQLTTYHRAEIMRKVEQYAAKAE